MRHASVHFICVHIPSFGNTSYGYHVIDFGNSNCFGRLIWKNIGRIKNSNFCCSMYARCTFYDVAFIIWNHDSLNKITKKTVQIFALSFLLLVQSCFFIFTYQTYLFFITLSICGTRLNIINNFTYI